MRVRMLGLAPVKVRMLRHPRAVGELHGHLGRLPPGERAREVGILRHRHAARQRLDPRVGQGGRVVVVEARPAVTHERRHREGQREASAELRADVRVTEARRHGIGPHADGLDGLRRERAPSHQDLDAIERAVDVSPARVDLDEPARQQELLAEPAHRRLGVEAVGVDRAVHRRDTVGLTREPALHQRVREPSHRPAEAGVHVAHRGARGQRAAAGGHAERGAHVDDLAGGGGVVAEQARERHRRADGAEGAVGVHGQPCGRRPLDARAHLVADDEGGEKIAPGPGVMLGEGPRERDDLDAGMAIGVKIPLVHVDPGAGRAIEQGGARGIGAPAGTDHRGAARPRVSQVARDELAHLRDLHAVDGHPEAVGDHQAGALAHGGRQRVERRGGGPRAEAIEIVHAHTATRASRRSSLASMCSPARIGAYRGG